ncbi:UNVERIFIED_CONTAM: hypothetical protein GTU68_051412 [Idotea baltica]|nr:hypothetical protein [Idotea baltica]
MILQEDIIIEATENAGTLHDKLMAIGSELVLKTVKLIENEDVTTTPQIDTDGIKTAYKLNRDNCKVDWNNPIDDIYNMIRGLSPYPAAWSTFINGDEHLDVKIYKAEKEIEAHTNTIGAIISTKKSLKVSVKGGYINVLEIKLPGKKTMDIKSLLNGYHFESHAKAL